MYKLLLSWRYLRSRYIALASIVSVTLGVATLIVVNSVMSGFTTEMKKRLRGILSDVEIAVPGMGEIHNPDLAIAKVKETLGDDLEEVSAVVRTPAMVHLNYNGTTLTQQIMLMGIDDETYAKVSDFGPYLKNEQNREQISFMLRESGYDDSLPLSGWEYRRRKVTREREFQRQLSEIAPPNLRLEPSDSSPEETISLNSNAPESAPTSSQEDPGQLAPLPATHQGPSFSSAEQLLSQGSPELQPPAGGPSELGQGPNIPSSAIASDPFSASEFNPAVSNFDEMEDQYPGLILGMALASRRLRDPETGEATDYFLARPGDNVQLTLLNVGTPPRPVYSVCTVVDLYESKMHEYDASFAFMPISELQRIRGMMGPGGKPTSTAIQIRLKEDADLAVVKQKLQKAFPPDYYPYYIQTWEDAQRPLLAAVEMEITILNILLFMIIAVAGFGILATFFMIVVEKTRDIGILKALGAPSQGVMSIFLSYGFSLGIVGAGVGTLLGLIIVGNLNGIARFVEWITGREVFDPTVYYFSEIPTSTSPYMLLWVGIGAVLIAVMASVLPALRAARLHPVEALRYE